MQHTTHNDSSPFSQAGFSVIEVMLAAALFLMFSTGIISVILQGFDANRTGSEETIANQYATEGIEAARSIRNQGFASLVDTAGSGITRTGSGVWIFSGTTNTLNKYTRVITISDVQRDGSGNIVSSGGTVDLNTKKVTSTTSWNVSSSRADSVVLSTYLTNWKVPTQASCLTIDTSTAQRNHKQLLNITIKNVCSTAVILTKLTPTWTQSSNNISQIQINGTVVWSGSGVGSPTGNQPPGTVLTLQPYSIASNSAVLPIDFFQMTSNIQSNENWTISFTMTDNTQNTVTFTTQ